MLKRVRNFGGDVLAIPPQTAPGIITQFAAAGVVTEIRGQRSLLPFRIVWLGQAQPAVAWQFPQ